ncbi:MAG: hypothetical protein KGP29_05870 [Proteobacteria bacterium]|nr:hypothetical protein [Pseudomonadota bacterium]
MGLNGKNLTPQICKLLMEIVEQKNPNISHSVLFSEFGKDAAKFLIDQNYLTQGQSLESYWLGSEDKDVYVEWNEKLKSFSYLSSSGKFVAIDDDELKTFDANFEKIISFLSKEFDVLESSKAKQNQHLEGLLFFVGDARINKKKVAIFFARRLNDNEVLKKIEEFFIKESTSSLPKLILTSSNQHCPESLKTKAKIISIPKLLGLANSKALFNMDYVANIIFGIGNDEPKPDVYCTEDASTLFVGNKSWSIKGDKQRQIIKLMCKNYLENPEKKIRWQELLNDADIETSSRSKDFFKGSAVAEAINHKDGFVWFKTDEKKS